MSSPARRTRLWQAGSSELKTINQISNKLQFSNNQKLFDHWNLVFGYYLVIGAWSLVIERWPGENETKRSYSFHIQFSVHPPTTDGGMGVNPEL